jgi:hypothetical protein
LEDLTIGASDLYGEIVATPQTDRLTVYVECEIRDTPLPKGFTFTANSSFGIGGIIPPHSELLGGNAPVGTPITPQDILELEAGRRYIYLWGWAKYFDVFPNTPEHLTHFCWAITIGGDPLTFGPSVTGTPPTVGTLSFGYQQHTEGNYTKENTGLSEPS